jgi:hypothetical protein
MKKRGEEKLDKLDFERKLMGCTFTTIQRMQRG